MKKNSLKEGVFKEVRLFPMHTMLDIWICNNQNNLCKQFSQRYGNSIEFWKEELGSNQVMTFKSTKDSDLKGETRIVMNITSIDLNVMVHEYNHVVYHLAAVCNFSLTDDSQEWHSYMLEYLLENSYSGGDFKKYEYDQTRTSK
jgi:hypothetical protein